MARRATDYQTRGTNNADRASRKPYIEPKHNQSISALVIDAGAYRDCSEQGESYADVNIGDLTCIKPRQSLTRRLGLEVKPQAVEYETVTLRRKQFDKKLNRMVETTDEIKRIVWKSDKSLLLRGKPDQFGEGHGTAFTRVTSHSKRRTYEPEIKTNPDNVVTIGESASGPTPTESDIAEIDIEI